MARPARFERTTVRLEGGCSIHLSYGRGQQDISRRGARAQARQFSLVEISNGFRQSDFVKITKFLALVLLAAFLAGCKKTETVAASPSLDDILPKQAQPTAARPATSQRL